MYEFLVLLQPSVKDVWFEFSILKLKDLLSLIYLEILEPYLYLKNRPVIFHCLIQSISICKTSSLLFRSVSYVFIIVIHIDSFFTCKSYMLLMNVES